MGREIKRVPAGFDWPLNERWWGFVIPCVPCGTCLGRTSSGRVSYRTGSWQEPDEAGQFWCPSCEGEKAAPVEVPVPEGEAWQLWETTSEGSPISPAFDKPEELARWLADTKASSFGAQTETYETWFAWITGAAWAPSAVLKNGVLQSGVAAMPGEAPK